MDFNDLFFLFSSVLIKDSSAMRKEKIQKWLSGLAFRIAICNLKTDFGKLKMQNVKKLTSSSLDLAISSPDSTLRRYSVKTDCKEKTTFMK